VSISYRIVTIAATLGIAALTVLSPAAAGSSPDVLPAPKPLGEIADAVLPVIAGVNDLPVDQLRRMARGHHFEVDRQGTIRSVEAPLAATGEASTLEVPAGVDVFALHSRPTSTRTIYLDFDGHSVQDTLWLDGAKIDAPAYDTDGDPTTFSAAERQAVYEVFQATAEDYRPFDVDVTTQTPPLDRITRTGTKDLEFGTRVVITPKDVTGCGCGGQAYVGVFDKKTKHESYQPAWVVARAGANGKVLSDAVSHEAGHNLGLDHDGESGGVGYHAGHENWAPIMGVGYGQPVTQWSKGEYANANNVQDDIKVMSGKGAPLLADDYTATAALAKGTPLNGIVNSDADTDTFSIDHAGGALTAAAVPALFAPNLDIRLTVRNAAGTVVATVDPPVARVSNVAATGLDARYTADLSAGRYTFQVEGVGYGDPSTNGYTGYGSVGQYTLTVS
jgi:hypothetical protein